MEHKKHISDSWFYSFWEFCTHVCDVFTCKNVLHTRPYIFYSHGCNVRAWNLFWASVANKFCYSWWFYCLYTCSYVFYSHGCNVFIHARLFFPLTDTTSIPWVRCFYVQDCSVHSLMRLLFPWVRCIHTYENVFYTCWYNLIPIVGTNFYHDNRSLALC